MHIILGYAMRKDAISESARNYRFVLLGATVLAAVVGLLLAVHSWHQTDEWLREALLGQAQLVARALSPATLRSLSGTEADLDSPQYRRLKEQFAAVRQIDERWEWLYLMGRRPGGTVFFYLDSEDDSDEDASPAGQVYEEASPLLHRVFDTKTATIEGPFKDAWGTWVSPLVPIIDPRSGEVLAVFGVDIEFGRWQRERFRAVAPTLAASLIVLVFPLLGFLLLFHRQRRGHSLGRLDVLLVLGTGLSLTLAVGTNSIRTERHHHRETFERIATGISSQGLEAFRTLQDNEILAMLSFFRASDWVDAAEFAEYAGRLTENPAIRSWGWAPEVPGTDRHRFEQEMRAGAAPDFRIWERDAERRSIPAAERETHYPLAYLAAVVDVSRALGFDLVSEPRRKAAMDETRTTGLPTATEPIELASIETPTTGIIAFAYVEPRLDNGTERQRGYVVASIELESVLRSISGTMLFTGDSQLATIDLWQLRPDQTFRLLGSSGPRDDLDTPPPSRTSHVQPVLVFGKPYALTVRPGPGLLAAHRLPFGWITVLNGLLLTAAATSFANLVARQRQTLQEQVEEQTESLRTSLERFNQLSEHSRTFVWEVDVQGIYTYASPNVADILGYQPEELVGKMPFYDLHPEEGREAFRKETFRLKETKEPIRGVVNPMCAKGGDVLWMSTDALPLLDQQGNLMGYRGSDTDISERIRADKELAEKNRQLRETAERLEQVMEATNARFDIVDRDFNLHYVDRRLCAIYGSPTGRKCYEYFMGLDEPCPDCGLPKVFASGEPTIHERTFPSEPERVFEVHKVPVEGTDGERMVAEFKIDISDRKHLEMEQESLRDQLMQSQKLESVGRLAGGVAHDFNNMLQAIIGNAELALSDTPTNSPAQEELTEIIKVGHRAAELTRQLLAFARKQTVAPVVLDLNETTGDMMGMLRRLIGEDIGLLWMPGADLWPVKVDPTQIGMVLANLCVNARDAIAGTGRITIECRNAALDEEYCARHATARPGEYVALMVSDNGTGMDRETLAHVFEPFFTTKQMGKGTGLGLPTVHGVAMQNGGFVNVYSEVGRGTTFRVYFPRYRGDEATRSPAVVEAAPDLPGGKETILVVEDEVDILNLCGSVLGKLGYRVLLASGPEDALFQLADSYDGPLDLLLTDVVMPEMDGRKLAETVAQHHPGIPCLYMSGYTANAIAHHGILDEGLDFLQKPFSNRELAETVRAILDRPDNRKQA